MLSGTALTTLALPDNVKSLNVLHLTNSPLMDIEAIQYYTELEDLDLSNTPLDDIYPVWKLSKLKKLDCSGTQIRRIDALEKLSNLEYFDCSNTNVNRLGSLDYINLKTLKCFNTKVPNRIIENFKASHPECSVMYYK
jgi:Leucine-rich repeat (LRR) protein